MSDPVTSTLTVFLKASEYGKLALTDVATVEWTIENVNFKAADGTMKASFNRYDVIGYVRV